jgi:hypothetical protein
MLITDFLTHVNKEADFPIYYTKTVNNTIKFVDNNPFADTYLSSYNKQKEKVYQKIVIFKCENALKYD